jgi:hypothetical protein
MIVYNAALRISLMCTLLEKSKEIQFTLQSWLKVCIPCAQIYAFLLCIGG